MKYQLEATWTRECHAISSQYIVDDMGEAERQHAVNAAMIQLLCSLQTSLNGVDPSTLRFSIKEIA